MLKNLLIAFQCFYRQSAYHAAFKDWRGAGAMYLAILCVLVTACWDLKWQLLLWQVSDAVSEVSHNVPGLAVKKGRLLLKSELPLVLSLRDRKRPILVVDTTGTADFTDKYAVPLVVREQDIRLYGFTDHEVTNVPKLTLPLNNLLSTLECDIDPSMVSKTVAQVCVGLLVVSFLGYFVFLFSTSVLQALFWAALAWCWLRLKKTSSAFLPLVRVASLALTPSLAIRAVTALFGVDLPFLLDVVVFLIYLGYLYFAYRAYCSSRLLIAEMGTE